MQLTELKTRLEQLHRSYPRNKLFNDMLVEVNQITFKSTKSSNRDSDSEKYISPLLVHLESEERIKLVKNCQDDLKQRGAFRRLFFPAVTREIKTLKHELLESYPNVRGQLFLEKIEKNIYTLLDDKYLQGHFKSIAKDRRDLAKYIRNQIIILQAHNAHGKDYAAQIAAIFRLLMQSDIKIIGDDKKHCGRNFFTSSRLRDIMTSHVNKILLFAKTSVSLQQKLVPLISQELWSLWEKYASHAGSNFNFKQLLQAIPKNLRQPVKDYQAFLISVMGVVEESLFESWRNVSNPEEDFDFAQLKQKLKKDIKEYQKLNVYEDLLVIVKKEGLEIKLSI